MVVMVLDNTLPRRRLEMFFFLKLLKLARVTATSETLAISNFINKVVSDNPVCLIQSESQYVCSWESSFSVNKVQSRSIYQSKNI